MAGQLSAFGYSLSDNPDEADLWLINTSVFYILISLYRRRCCFFDYFCGITIAYS
jgi:hypothetical protein